MSSLALCLYGPALTTVHGHWADRGLGSTDLYWQSDVPAVQPAVEACRSVPAKKQPSAFTAAGPIRSDLGAQEEGLCHRVHLFPFCLPRGQGATCHDLSFFKYVVLSRLFTVLLHPRQEAR